jgi:hypothetical protein
MTILIKKLYRHYFNFRSKVIVEHTYNLIDYGLNKKI